MNKTTRSLIMLGLSILVALTSVVVFVRGRGVAVEEPQTTTQTATTTEEPKAEEKQEEKAEEPSERDAFVAEWAGRIDAFNAGYPLAGYGATFAEAAYDNGVDPRVAPAIARVESASGSACTYSCNAWGWGSYSWGDWDTAIREYTALYAAAYGSKISYDIAYVYTGDSASADEWYAQAESCMYSI